MSIWLTFTEIDRSNNIAREHFTLIDQSRLSLSSESG